MCALPVLHAIEDDVIPGKDIKMRIKADELRRSFQDDARLFQEFAMQGRLDRLAFLHTPSRKVPARPITMAHEQNTSLSVHDNRLNAKRNGQAAAPSSGQISA